MTTTDSKPTRGAADSLPTAVVTQRQSLLQSKFWILTGLALLLAIGLAWWSTPKPGTRVDIHFPNGHGLHEGDAVRYRGINVGNVRDIRLSDHDGVDVAVDMDSSAERLLQEGTRFWIVRPQLDLTGVSGLETAVGPKYIAVEPDRSAKDAVRCVSFAGLTNPPAITGDGQGIEIVLRADKQFGVRPGSALTYRGLDIGIIMDARLTDDGRHVDLRASIDDSQRRLITSKSKFWANSGVDVDFSLRGGLSLDTESLETIARGGISVLTIGVGGQPLAPGQVFTLHGQAEDAWLEQANQVRLPTVPLKGAVTVVVTRKKKGLLGTRNEVTLFSAVPIINEAGKQLVLPTSVLNTIRDETAEKTTVHIDGISEPADRTLLETILAAAAETEATEDQPSVSRVPAPAGWKLAWQRSIGPLLGTEDLLVARRPIGSAGEVYVHLPIAASALSANESRSWNVTEPAADPQLWNGSPALSKATGLIVGVLVFENGQAMVVPIDSPRP